MDESSSHSGAETYHVLHNSSLPPRKRGRTENTSVIATNPFVNHSAILQSSNMVPVQADLQKLLAISQISIALINQFQDFNVDKSQLQVLANLIADFNGSKGITNESLPKLHNIEAQGSQLVIVNPAVPLMTTITPVSEPSKSSIPTNPENMALLKQTSPKEYPCETCKLKFKTAYNRNRHAKIHSGVKAYKCNYLGCNQEFSYFDHLVRHKRGTHENLRPFLCEICGTQSFNRKSNLLRHMKTQHGMPRPSDAT